MHAPCPLGWGLIVLHCVTSVLGPLACVRHPSPSALPWCLEASFRPWIARLLQLRPFCKDPCVPVKATVHERDSDLSGPALLVGLQTGYGDLQKVLREQVFFWGGGGDGVGVKTHGFKIFPYQNKLNSIFPEFCEVILYLRTQQVCKQPISFLVSWS